MGKIAVITIAISAVLGTGMRDDGKVSILALRDLLREFYLELSLLITFLVHNLLSN